MKKAHNEKQSKNKSLDLVMPDVINEDVITQRFVPVVLVQLMPQPPAILLGHSEKLVDDPFELWIGYDTGSDEFVQAWYRKHGVPCSDDLSQGQNEGAWNIYKLQWV